MKYAVLILKECDTDDGPRNEMVVEAETREEAVAESEQRYKTLLFGKDEKFRAARVRRLSEEELAARYNDYKGYMNGGYLDYFNPFTGEGYLD